LAALPSEAAVVPPVLPGPQVPLALAELQPLAVLLEPPGPSAWQASRLAAFRPKQKGKREMQQE
jgi:hypothetical protein